MATSHPQVPFTESVTVCTLGCSPCHPAVFVWFQLSLLLCLFLFPSLVHRLTFSLHLMLSRSHLDTLSQPIYTCPKGWNIRFNQRIRLFHAHPLTTQVLNCPDSHVISIQKHWKYSRDLSSFLISSFPLTHYHSFTVIFLWMSQHFSQFRSQIPLICSLIFNYFSINI